MNQHNSEASGTGIPHFYLLPVDSGINLSTSEPQLLPFHVLSNSTDYNSEPLFLPITKKVNDQDQNEAAIDACQEPVGINLEGPKILKVENVYQQTQKHVLHSQTQSISEGPSLLNIIPRTLPRHIAEAKFKAVNNSNQSQDIISYNKQSIQNYVHISDRIVPPRARLVLPTVLRMRMKDVICPRSTLLPYTRFGPVQGIQHEITQPEADELALTAITNKVPLFIFKSDNGFVQIDVSDKDKSNWIGLLRLGDEHSANVWLYEEKNELYVLTTQAIQSRKPLMLGYSTKYARDYGLIGPTRDIETECLLNKKSSWCSKCQRALPSAGLLKRHMNTYHQEDKPVPRRRHRCKHCSRTFSRIFTLRRHVAHYCDNAMLREYKFEKSVNNTTQISSESIPEASLNSSLNMEDTRVPSDESFQNYSNGLDFSTNLFDTDRMPGLDISGNSRSEVFNPYELGSDSPLLSVLDFTNATPVRADVSPRNIAEAIRIRKDSVKVKCTYCKQDLCRGKRRKHANECPARRFECQCKKVFPNKDLLALHIFTQHCNDTESKEKKPENTSKTSADTAQNATTYACEQCELKFKRRGMLVNHLWRIHNTVSARVPLARRERRYPCAACPKLYRAAAKRDRHVALHHPGALERAAPLELGTRAVAPAPCAWCPRQYCTRAKLLQHMRRDHPHAVDPQQMPKKTNVKTNKSKKNNNKSARRNVSEEKERN